MTTTATAQNAWANVDWSDVPTPDSELADIGIRFDVDAGIGQRAADRTHRPTDIAAAHVYGEAAKLILTDGRTRAQVAQRALDRIHESGIDIAHIGMWHRVLERLALEPRRVAHTRRHTHA